MFLQVESGLDKMPMFADRPSSSSSKVTSVLGLILLPIQPTSYRGVHPSSNLFFLFLEHTTLSCRHMEDFVTWVDTSKLKRTIMKYNDEVCSLLAAVSTCTQNINPWELTVLTLFPARRLRSLVIARILGVQERSLLLLLLLCGGVSLSLLPEDRYCIEAA